MGIVSLHCFHGNFSVWLYQILSPQQPVIWPTGALSDMKHSLRGLPSPTPAMYLVIYSSIRELFLVINFQITGGGESGFNKETPWVLFLFSGSCISQNTSMHWSRCPPLPIQAQTKIKKKKMFISSELIASEKILH